MVITVSMPSYCRSEVEWICSVLFDDFYGVDYHLNATNDSDISFELAGKKILMPIIFFSIAQSNWLSDCSVATKPVASWDLAFTPLESSLVGTPLPVLFGKPELEVGDDVIRIGVDIVGTIFYMLSRYEEAVLFDRDKHDRFPSVASIAYKANFLHRPIVDEYTEVLWVAIKRLWPFLERKTRQARTLVSCDVDTPYMHGCKSVFRTVRHVGADLLKRRSLSAAKRTITNCVCGLQGDFTNDPYLNAIDWIMDVNEEVGNRVAFYFITARTHPTFDGCYDLDEPVLRCLLRRIAERGHEIGLHASYNTYKNVSQTCREADILRQALLAEGLRQDVLGGRQHFLRWQTPTTGRNLEAAGINYDSSLAFADRPGFRCGTCHEFTMYDVIERRSLKLRQRPLVVMECSVIDHAYLGLGYNEEALELMMKYKTECHRFGGSFTLLWHNSHLTTSFDRTFYRELIR